MSAMHFHEQTLCFVCGQRRQLTTPIPDTVILSSECERCASVGLVGTWEFRVCSRCAAEWARRAQRVLDMLPPL